MTRILLALAAALLFPLGANAQAVNLYAAVGGGTESSLYILSTGTGAPNRVVGPIGHGVTGMARHPTTGIMYGVTTNTPACARCLITINLVTGAGTVVGPLGLTIAEIAFRSDGTLFGWSESSDDLATIDTTTGAATAVGASGLGTFGDGLVFVGSTLYVMPEGDTGSIYTMNQATGAPTFVATLTGSPIGTGVAVSAATRGPNGLVYAALQNFGGPPANLVTVNVNTGAITDVGPTLIGVDAIEFAPSPGNEAMIPTMSEWALVLMALLMLGAGAYTIRRRQG